AEANVARSTRAQKPHIPFGNTRAPRLMASALTLPRLSRTVNVTVMGNHAYSCGSAGSGKRAQLVEGSVRTAPVVLSTNLPATAKLQSHATIVPGAEDVLPSNVHASV